MRSPSVKQPGRRRLCADPAARRRAMPQNPSYVGSPEHKDYATATWRSPRPRADATICPRLEEQVAQQWLSDAFVDGFFSEFSEGEYPRYVWHRRDGQWFEGRLTNQEQGQYKGYPITVADLPVELRRRFS